MAQSTIAPTVPNTFTVRGENLQRDMVINVKGEIGFRFDGTSETVYAARVVHAEIEDGFVDLYVRNIVTNHMVHVEGNLGKDYDLLG